MLFSVLLSTTSLFAAWLFVLCAVNTLLWYEDSLHKQKMYLIKQLIWWSWNVIWKQRLQIVLPALLTILFVALRNTSYHSTRWTIGVQITRCSWMLQAWWWIAATIMQQKTIEHKEMDLLTPLRKVFMSNSIWCVLAIHNPRTCGCATYTHTHELCICKCKAFSCQVSPINDWWDCKNKDVDLCETAGNSFCSAAFLSCNHQLGLQFGHPKYYSILLHDQGVCWDV